MLSKLFLNNQTPIEGDHLFQYSHVENGLLFCKNGLLIKCFAFSGSVMEATETIDYHSLHKHIGKALKSLAQDYIIQKTDYYYPKVYQNKQVDYFNDFHQLDIDTHFQGRIGLNHKSYLFLVQLPNSAQANPLTTLLTRIGYDTSTLKSKEIESEKIKEMEESIDRFQYALNGSGLTIKAVEEPDEIMAIIHNGLNFSFEDYSRPSYQLSADIETFPRYIKLGNQQITYVSLSGQPEEALSTIKNENGIAVSMTYPIHLGLAFPHTVNTIIRKCDRDKKLKGLDREKFLNFSMSQDDVVGIKSEEQQIRFDAVRQATVAIRSGAEDIFDIGISVGVISSSNEVHRERVNRVVHAFSEIYGMESVIEGKDNLSLFWSLLPGMCKDYYRTISTTSSCAAAYLNTDKMHAYNEVGELFIDRHLFPVRFELASDSTNNKHAIIIGPSGSGKSFSMNYIIKSRHKRKWRQIIIDIGGSYRHLVNIEGGMHIDYDPENPIRLNPFLIGNNTGLAIEQDHARIDFLVYFIATMYKDNLAEVGLTAVEYALMVDWVCAYLNEEQTKGGKASLGKFYRYLVDLIEQNLDDRKKANQIKLFPVEEMLAGLELYARGIYKHLFNHEEVEDYSDIALLSFDLEKVSGTKYYALVFALINQITKVLIEKYPALPKAIVMDECWVQLDKQPKFIEYYSRAGRKLNVALQIITQGVDELIKSPIGDTLILNTDTKILFDHQGKESEIKQIQEHLSLTPHETDLLNSLGRGIEPRYREFFVKQGLQSYVLGLEVPKNMYPTFTTEPKERSVFNDLVMQTGNVRKAQLSFASTQNTSSKKTNKLW